MKKPITTYYLEMTSPSELKPSLRREAEITLMQARLANVAFMRFLYSAVGAQWYWVDRLRWTDEQWFHYLNRAEVWVGYVEGTPAGYFELDLHDQSNVEIAYFGLLPEFIGKGYGGCLLTKAIERAWETGAEHVWVHTCTLDHPASLNNYMARGMKIYKQEAGFQEIPEELISR